MVDLADINLEKIASSFDNTGYDLMMENRVSYSHTIEESIVSALLKQEPRLVEGIPVLLVKNNIDYDVLKDLIDQYQLWNEFGYLGEFTLKHTENEELRDLVDHCYSRLKPSAELYSHAFFKNRQKEEEKPWKVTGGPSYSALEKQVKRYL